jgi:hypothetical protein
MRTILVLLMFASAGFGQARTAPEQGPPPKNLTQQPDGHFSANSEPANPEKFEIRVVKAGDTLSMIAAEVLNNPRLWPQLWEQNEHILNPHWIYPNDKILIRPITLITEAIPPPPEPPSQPVPEPIPSPAPPAPEPEPVAAEPLVAAVPEPAPVVREGNFSINGTRVVSEVKDDDLYCSGFIRRAALPRDLRVIGKFQDTLSVFAVDSEYIYVSKGAEDGMTNGTSYQVIRPTRTVTNPKGRTKDEQNLGMHYLEVAQVTVVVLQPDYSLARVIRNCGDPIEVGDIMLPFQRLDVPAPPLRRPFSPLMKATGDIKGSVVIAKSALLNYGSVFKLSSNIPGVGGRLGSLSRGIAHDGSIVYVDIGQGQGVKPGDLFIVYKDVDLESPLYDLPTESKKVKGARIAIGELIIIKVGERASTALVTYASEGISLGNFVERR